MTKDDINKLAAIKLKSNEMKTSSPDPDDIILLRKAQNFYGYIQSILLSQEPNQVSLMKDEQPLMQYDVLPSLALIAPPDMFNLNELSQPLPLTMVLFQDELATILEDNFRDGDTALVSSPGHSISIFKKPKDKYQIYNSSHHPAIEYYDDCKALAQGIRKHAFEKLGHTVPQMPISLNILSRIRPDIPETRNIGATIKKVLDNRFQKVGYKQLSLAGCNKNCCDNRFTLQMAALAGRIDELKLLLSHDVNLTQVNPEGQTALHSAAIRGNVAAAALFLNKSKDKLLNKNSSVGTPLCLAALNGRLPMVTFLIDQGANLNLVRDDNQRGPLSLAAEAGHADVVKYLLNHEAKWDALDKYGDSPLHLTATHRGGQVIAELLIEAANKAHLDININTKGNHGETALYKAAKTGKAELVPHPRNALIFKL